MNQESGRTFDQALLSVWQDELKAIHNPSIKQQCLEREPDLLPRFAAQYQELKTLRRRMRRGLQRQWKRSLAGVALLVALGQAPALAATINVSGTVRSLEPSMPPTVTRQSVGIAPRVVVRTPLCCLEAVRRR
jgi:hypothetical protein